MKKRRNFMKMLAILPAVLCGACGGGNSGSASDNEIVKTEEEWRTDGGYAYYYYEQLGRETMPIGAWCAPPSPWGTKYTENYITKENYRILSESGINSIYALYENASDRPQSVIDALNFCDEFGMVYLVRDFRMLAAGQEPELLELFETYQNMPAYGGNLVVDEPGYVTFEQLGDLKKVWDGYELTKDKLMYVNMLPSYASVNQLINGAGGGTVKGEISYLAYLQKYVSMVNPSMLSFDFYPFNGHDATEFREGYYQQLHDVKTYAKNADIPFWTFAQVGYYQSKPVRIMPEGELLWQVNTALAYGAKGIQYFCYWTPYEMDNDAVGFVGTTGEKLYLYDYGVKANKQIAAVDDVLMKSANVGVIQVGNTPDPIPEADKLTQYDKLIAAEGCDALIGCFDYRGKTAFYVASNNYAAGGDVTLRFSEKVNARIVQNAITTNKKSDALTLTLTAGEGVLVVLE